MGGIEIGDVHGWIYHVVCVCARGTRKLVNENGGVCLQCSVVVTYERKD